MKEHSSVGLGYYFTVLKRQWITILAAALIGLMAMVGYVALVPGKTVASTVINVNVIVADPFNPSRPASGLLDTATEAKLATSYVVASSAAKSLNGTETPSDLRDGISVTTGINATIVTISFASTTEARARAGADAVANSYISYRESHAEETKKKMIGNLEKQLGSLNEAAKTLGTADKTVINARISNVEYQINQITTIDTGGGSVITPAAENPVVTKPQPSLLLVSGLLGGWVLGIILAFAINAMARRVRDTYDVDTAGTGPVIVTMDAPSGLVPPRGADLVAYRSLRERLLASTGSGIGVLAIIDETSSRAGSFIGQGLAFVLAPAGHRVELVMMGATASDQEQLTQDLDLTLSSVDSHEDLTVLTSTLVPGLSVVYPMGDMDGSDADTYVTDAVRQRVSGRLSDVTVLLVLPPEAAISSRLAAVRLSHSALLVAELRRTESSTLSARAEELLEMDTPCHGVVLVRKTPHKPPETSRRSTANLSSHRQQVSP